MKYKVGCWCRRHGNLSEVMKIYSKYLPAADVRRHSSHASAGRFSLGTHWVTLRTRGNGTETEPIDVAATPFEIMLQTRRRKRSVLSTAALKSGGSNACDVR